MSPLSCLSCLSSGFSLCFFLSFSFSVSISVSISVSPLELIGDKVPVPIKVKALEFPLTVIGPDEGKGNGKDEEVGIGTWEGGLGPNIPVLTPTPTILLFFSATALRRAWFAVAVKFAVAPPPATIMGGGRVPLAPDVLALEILGIEGDGGTGGVLEEDIAFTGDVKGTDVVEGTSDPTGTLLEEAETELEIEEEAEVEERFECEGERGGEGKGYRSRVSIDSLPWAW